MRYCTCLKNLVLCIFGLLLYVGHDGSNGLDDGNNKRAKGGRAGMIKQRRRDGTTDGTAADLGFLVAGEVPRCHRHRHHDLCHIAKKKITTMARRLSRVNQTRDVVA